MTGRKPRERDGDVQGNRTMRALRPCLSEDPLEYQLRDRLSCMRFLDLGREYPVPDPKTIRLYRERLSQVGLMELLFHEFDRLLQARSWRAKGGWILDASIVAAPRPHNRCEENAESQSPTIRPIATPTHWKKKPAKRDQKDTDARWTRESTARAYFLATKNHIEYGLTTQTVVRRDQTTNAAVVQDE